MNKKDLHKIIKEELDKIRSEADTKVQDQGYAGDYYHVKSDIIETWADDQTITNDIKGFLNAAFDTAGGSTQGDTKQGGSNLVKMVTNAILKGIQEYRKSEPKDYMREEKADKDYDGDGKIESPSAEYKGSVDKAIKKNMKEEDETSFLSKSDFDVEKLDAGDLLEYDLVLDDLMAVIKKYKWIPNLDKSVIAKQVLHDKKLVGDAIKKQKGRSAIRKDYTPKAGRI